MQVNESLHPILDRIRKEVRYSAITTMSMRLAKLLKLYGPAQLAAKNEGIKIQKNFSIIALRISFAYNNLVYGQGYTPHQAAFEICNYFNQNLPMVLKQKYRRENQSNSDLFMETAEARNRQDIQTFERILRTGLQNPSEVGQRVQMLFEKDIHGNHDRCQRQSIQRLTRIFCKYGGGLDYDERPHFTMQDQQPEEPEQLGVDIFDFEQKQQKNYLGSTGIQSQVHIPMMIEAPHPSNNQMQPEPENPWFGYDLPSPLDYTLSWEVPVQNDLFIQGQGENIEFTDWFSDV